MFLILSTQVSVAQTELSVKTLAQAPVNQSTNPIEITLFEKGDKLVLFNNGTCSLNDLDKISVNEENNPWQSIINKPYLEKLSGLAILEQVKQQARQSRMIMEIDTDNETKLTIQSNERTQSIALYSIDLMHATYPKARQLSQLMAVVELMREAKTACAP